MKQEPHPNIDRVLFSVVLVLAVQTGCASITQLSKYPETPQVYGGTRTYKEFYITGTPFDLLSGPRRVNAGSVGGIIAIGACLELGGMVVLDTLLLPLTIPAEILSDDPPAVESEPERVESLESDRDWGRIITGELIALFPGLIVPGLGHRYAGDIQTANRLYRRGLVGQLLTAAGAGITVGGIALIDESLDGDNFDSAPLELILGGILVVVGGIGGGVGMVGYGGVWIFDIVETPRVIRAGQGDMDRD